MPTNGLLKSAVLRRVGEVRAAFPPGSKCCVNGRRGHVLSQPYWSGRWFVTVQFGSEFSCVPIEEVKVK